MDKNKKILTILITLTIIFTTIGSSLAYLSWVSSEEQKTQITFTATAGFSCSADGGGNITESDVNIVPTLVNENTTGNYIKRTVSVKPTITESGKTIYMDLWLDINNLGTGLSNSVNFRYAFTTGSDSPTTGVVVSGNFNGKKAGDKINLLTENQYTTTSTETYYLWIWLDSEETSIETMNQTFSLSLNGSCYDHISVTANSLINNANPSTLSYADATDSQKGEMWTFLHDATEQVEATIDYRYIGNKYCSYELGQYGAPINSYGTCPKRYNYVRTTISDSTTKNYTNQPSCPSSTSVYTYKCTKLTNDGIVGVEPNNYITFNDEVWRIIGVFDGRIKIIRNDSLGDLYWDYKRTWIGTSNSSGGSNDWTDSQLMYMLNSTSYKLKDGYTEDGTYIYDGNGNIIYQLGCRPASIGGGATSYSCTSNTWSLNSTALSQISEATYYLGGSSSSSGQSASSYYAFERGTTVYSGRSTNWKGLVGLMYPSDYAYTFANGIDDTCYTDTYNCYTTKPSSSWLYKSGTNQFTVSTFSNDSSYVFVVRGDVSWISPSVSTGVRPVVYLKSDIKLQGSGTSDNPYEIIT